MDALKKLFPFKSEAGDIKSLIIAIVIYLIIGAVAGFVIGLISNLPLLGLLVGIVGFAVDIYCVVGIVISVITYLDK